MESGPGLLCDWEYNIRRSITDTKGQTTSWTLGSDIKYYVHLHRNCAGVSCHHKELSLLVDVMLYLWPYATKDVLHQNSSTDSCNNDSVHIYTGMYAGFLQPDRTITEHLTQCEPNLKDALLGSSNPLKLSNQLQGDIFYTFDFFNKLMFLGPRG